VEAEIFEEDAFTIGEHVDGGGGSAINAVMGGELHPAADSAAEDFGEADGAWLEAELFLEAGTGGATEVGHEDEAAAAREDTIDGCECHADSAVIGDMTVFEGDVEVDAHEDAAAANFHLINPALRH